MRETKVEQCHFVRSSFYYAKLRDSEFWESDLTGVDLRNADLTRVNLNKCHLHGANFYQTQRGGINLNIIIEDIKASNNQEDKKPPNNQEDKKEEINMKSSCFIDFIEWSPKKDGGIQINKNDFLMIVSGMTSPVAVLSSLSKDNPSFISYIYNEAKAEANAKSAGQDLNDASVNIGRDVNESDVNGGSNETKSYENSEQGEEETPENIDPNDEEGYNEDEQQ